MSRKKREIRYEEKISYGKTRLKNCLTWIKELKSEEDEKTLLACYKAAQEVNKSLVDLLAMLLKDLDQVPKDDYHNIELAEKIDLLSQEDKKTLNEFNGLRNRLVHEYNGVSVDIAIKSLEILLPKTEQIFQRIETWMKRLFQG